MNLPHDGRIPPVLPSFTAQVLNTRPVAGSGPLLTQPALGRRADPAASE